MKTAILIILTITHIEITEDKKIDIDYTIGAKQAFVPWDDCFKVADRINREAPLVVGGHTAVCMPQSIIEKAGT